MPTEMDSVASRDARGGRKGMMTREGAKGLIKGRSGFEGSGRTSEDMRKAGHLCVATFSFFLDVGGDGGGCVWNFSD
jgi:hypothetical protein